MTRLPTIDPRASVAVVVAVVLVGLLAGLLRLVGGHADLTGYPGPELEVASVGGAQFEGYKHMHKFGGNQDIGTSYETVWDMGGDYNWMTSATVMQLSSASANDTSAGTGCRTVQIEGLNGDYDEITESFTMNGQTQVTGTLSFLRVHRVYCLTNGTNNVNAGQLYVSDTATALSSGVPTPTTKIRAAVLANNGQSLMAVYTVPDGGTPAMIATEFGASSILVPVNTQVQVRSSGGPWRVQWEGTGMGAIFDKRWYVPQPVAPRSDIRVRMKALSGADQIATAGFTLQWGY